MTTIIQDLIMIYTLLNAWQRKSYYLQQQIMSPLFRSHFTKPKSVYAHYICYHVSTFFPALKRFPPSLARPRGESPSTLSTQTADRHHQLPRQINFTSTATMSQTMPRTHSLTCSPKLRAPMCREKYPRDTIHGHYADHQCTTTTLRSACSDKEQRYTAGGSVRRYQATEAARCVVHGDADLVVDDLYGGYGSDRVVVCLSSVRLWLDITDR